MHKIVLVGDSVLARVNQDGAVALRPRLEAAFPERALDVLAVGGASSETTIANIAGYTFDAHDLVVISLGLNDAAPWKQIPLEQFIANYKTILETIGHKNIVLLAPTFVDTVKQGQPGRDNATINQYAQGVRDLADSYELQFVDGFEIIRSHQKDELHVADGVHLNTAGYDLIAKHLLQCCKGLEA